MNFLHRLHAALGVNIEVLQRVHRVAPEIGADGVRRIRRVKVQDPAAQGELSRALHHVATLVARRRKGVDTGIHRHLAAGGNRDHSLLQLLRRDGKL